MCITSSVPNIPTNRYVYKDSDSVGVVVETTKMLESLMGDDGEGLASANGVSKIGY